MLYFNKTFKIRLRNRYCLRVPPAYAIMWDGLRKGDTAEGWSPGKICRGRKQEVPGVSTKGVETTQSPPGKLRP